ALSRKSARQGRGTHLPLARDPSTSLGMIAAGLRRPAKRDHFLSTSTYSASITPSSFLASPLPPVVCPALPLAPTPPPGGGVCACADLYICSASLCEACVRVSRARSICALSFDSSAFFASANAFSTSPRSEPEILSPCSFSIFSI